VVADLNRDGKPDIIALASGDVIRTSASGNRVKLRAAANGEALGLS
jgi:hypothetical protein